MKCLLNIQNILRLLCLPPCGGSGLKCLDVSADCLQRVRLPPCGGSGLKYLSEYRRGRRQQSPSMRREWIEMFFTGQNKCFPQLSPSMRREWIEIFWVIVAQEKAPGLPPCGGSGLKCRVRAPETNVSLSPSMRREWIEIFQVPNC